MIEGSGSGSIPLTSGYGSGRSKHMWIRNTGSNCCSLQQTQAEYYLPQRDKKYLKRVKAGSILPLFAGERSSWTKATSRCGLLWSCSFYALLASFYKGQIRQRGKNSDNGGEYRANAYGPYHVNDSNLGDFKVTILFWVSSPPPTSLFHMHS